MKHDTPLALSETIDYKCGEQAPAAILLFPELKINLSLTSFFPLCLQLKAAIKTAFAFVSQNPCSHSA